MATVDGLLFVLKLAAALGCGLIAGVFPDGGGARGGGGVHPFTPSLKRWSGFGGAILSSRKKTGRLVSSFLCAADAS